MRDNDLKVLLATQLDLAVSNAGWNFPVVQKNQPHQEGTPDGPTVFFEKLFDTSYGFARMGLEYSAPDDSFTESEQQWIQTTFQISALCQEDPSDTTKPTAGDIANQMKLHMGSRFVVRAWSTLNVGVLRTTQVRGPYFEDDKLRFEQHPSFDLVITHIRTLDNSVPAVHHADVEYYVVP